MSPLEAPGRHRLNLPGAAIEISAFHLDVTVAVEAVGSNVELAGLLGVDRSQVGRWLRGATGPAKRQGQLRDLAYVWRRLLDDAPEADVRDWLGNRHNPRLGGRPLQAIADGRVTEVLGAWDAHHTASYP